MPDPNFAIIVSVFALAGIVKGVIGLGLPTVAMGLLALAMPPVEAAAILIVPSLVTNIWQMLTVRGLGRGMRRLWPMMAAICVGTWLAPGLTSNSLGGYATVALGVGLVMYALAGLSKFRIAVRPDLEIWLSPLAGAITGAIAAATGVFAIPAVPYLQGLGLDKDGMVQALGLSFTVSTVALAGKLAWSGALAPSMAGEATAALAASIAGMMIGQAVRARLSQDAFRFWLFAGLLALGLYIAGHAVL